MKKTDQNSRKRTKEKGDKQSVRCLWDNFKRSNIHLIWVPEGKEKEQEVGNVFEKLMKENFGNLAK